MGRLLLLIARGGGRVDCPSWEALAELLNHAGLIQKAHPSNLQHWAGELKACKILAVGSPGWIVFPPDEGADARRRPHSRPAKGLRLSALCGLNELIAAGWDDLGRLRDDLDSDIARSTEGRS